MERPDRLLYWNAGLGHRLPLSRPGPHELTRPGRFCRGCRYTPLLHFQPARRSSHRPVGPQARDDSLRYGTRYQPRQHPPGLRHRAPDAPTTLPRLAYRGHALRLIIFGGDPIGLALTGILLQVIGTVPAVLIYTGGLVALAAATTLNRHVRSAPTVARARTT